MDIALIAGEGILPEEVAMRLTDAGTPPVVYAVRESVGALSKYAWDVVHLQRAEVAGALINMKMRGIKRVILAGAVPKTLVYQPAMMDAAAQELLQGLSSRDDHAILGKVVSVLEKFGFKVEGYADIVPDLLAPMGHFAGRKPSQEETKDIEYGRRVSSAILPLSFGQTVVVNKLAVVAVEAMEGTDATLLRAGALCRGGVIVKMMRTDQDIRYDMPTVGPDTIKHMSKAGLKCLAVEAGRTLVLKREEFAAMAGECDIAVTGVESCSNL